MEMYIFIDKKCLLKPFTYQSYTRLSAIKQIWYVHLSMFLNNMFQKFDHLSPLWKCRPPKYTPSTKFLLPPPKVNRPPIK